MILYRAAKAGFCFGVKRAIELAEKTARDRDGPIYSLGHIIHNTQVVEQLSQQGIIKIDSLDEAMAGGTLLLRSHGEGSDIIQQAQDKSLDIIDTTCPFVSKAQKIAATMAAEGKKVVIVGDRNHPEVKGIMA